MAITVIFAPPRTGKTALMAYLLTIEAFNYDRIKSCKDEIRKLNNGGFNLSYPGYITACNFTLESHKFGYSPRMAKLINPYRIGFLNESVETHFLPPYCCVGIMEGQKYFNSRLFKLYPDWQSRFYEMHGHNHYDFYIDTQRPHLIDVNIRELADFIDIQRMDIVGDNVVWQFRRIASSFELDKYFECGKRDYFTEELITAPKEVLNYYDTREAKPLFYAGRSKKNFDVLKPMKFKVSVDDYERYCKLHAQELPKNFYQKV